MTGLVRLPVTAPGWDIRDRPHRIWKCGEITGRSSSAGASRATGRKTTSPWKRSRAAILPARPTGIRRLSEPKMPMRMKQPCWLQFRGGGCSGRRRIRAQPDRYGAMRGRGLYPGRQPGPVPVPHREGRPVQGVAGKEEPRSGC